MFLTKINGQYVIEYQEPKSSFSAATEPAAEIWHLGFRHLGQEALSNVISKVKPHKLHSPTIIHCEACSRAKAANVINHSTPKHPSPRPFWRTNFDIFEHILLPITGNICAGIQRHTEAVKYYLLPQKKNKCDVGGQGRHDLG